MFLTGHNPGYPEKILPPPKPRYATGSHRMQPAAA